MKHDGNVFSYAAEIAELRATKMQHEAVIKDLQREIDRLRERVNSLEQAKEMTESETFSKFEQQTDQLKSLKQVSGTGHMGPIHEAGCGVNHGVNWNHPEVASLAGSLFNKLLSVILTLQLGMWELSNFKSYH